MCLLNLLNGSLSPLFQAAFDILVEPMIQKFTFLCFLCMYRNILYIYIYIYIRKFNIYIYLFRHTHIPI